MSLPKNGPYIDCQMSFDCEDCKLEGCVCVCSNCDGEVGGEVGGCDNDCMICEFCMCDCDECHNISFRTYCIECCRK